jgi:hypothetical protein
VSWLQSRPMSSNTKWKWAGVIALGVVGILAFIVAIFWLSEPIHSLPSFIGGKHGRGHYKRRGEALIVLAIVVIGVAAYLGYRLNRSGKRSDATPAGGEAAAPTDSGSLLSAAASPPASPSPAPTSDAPRSEAPSETAIEPQ